MRVFDITPLVGVGPVEFGITRDEVREALGEEARPFWKRLRMEHMVDAFETLGFHVYYQGMAAMVEFIEVHHEEGAAFRYEGVDIFRTPAPELIRILTAKTPGYGNDCEHTFPALQFGFYRSHPFDAEYQEFDRWESLGVGPTGYFPDRPRERPPRKGPPPVNPFTKS